MKYWFLQVAVKSSHDPGCTLALTSSNSSSFSLLYENYFPRRVDDKLHYQAWFAACIDLQHLLLEITMSRNHPYRSLQVPSDAPFELKPSPGKGWGAFATRPIERGAMILREKPLFVIRKPHENITEQDFWTAFQQLIPRDKQQFLCVRDNASKPFRSMTDAFAENSFAMSDDIKPLGHGLYILLSRLNHSCIPNSKVPVTESDGDLIANFATRDIAAGEEITFCYSRDFELRTRDDRHRALRFECDCKACLIGTPFQKLSDTRRTLIRGLQYLRLGIDIVGLGQKQGAASPIIFDPELRKAAETFSIPISARLIYSLLVVYLLEEEGLLDDFMVERFRPGILQMATLFKTESNARIARVAIAQQTWLEKLCMAFTLYGRADVADDEISKLLGMIQMAMASLRLGGVLHTRWTQQAGMDSPLT